MFPKEGFTLAEENRIYMTWSYLRANAYRYLPTKHFTQASPLYWREDFHSFDLNIPMS